MRPVVALALMSAVCAVVFFFAPHRKRGEYIYKALTLADIYADFFKNIPRMTRPGMRLLFLAGLAGLFACAFPALLVLMVWLLASGSGAAWLIISGIVACLGAVANFLLILVSHMSFGFGTSSERLGNVGTWAIPLFQFVFGVTGIAVGSSSACAAWAQRLIAP